MEEVIIVDKKDRQIRTEEKIKAHKKALLHRAFSVFVFNSKKELLMQKRAGSKYHSPDLWTNTCCSHPRPGETTLEAAHRRLTEEMGFDCELNEVFSFIYKNRFDNGLTEHELDHVFTGEFNGKPDPDPTEVGEFAWISLDMLKEEIKKHPNRYTAWFKILLKKYDIKASD